MGFQFRRVRTPFIISIGIALIAIFVVLTMIVTGNVRTLSETSAIESAEIAAGVAEDKMDTFFNDVEVLAKALASSEIVKTVQIDSMLDLFYNLVLSNKEYIRSIYLGTSDGRMLQRGFGPGFIDGFADLGPDYDPRTRPWYIDTYEAGSYIITKPYMFASISALGITAGIPVREDDGRLTGVLGIDLTLDKLQTIIKDMKLPYRGKGIILDREQKIIASQFDEREIQEIVELETALIDKSDVIVTNEHGVEYSNVIGEPHILAYKRNMQTDWSIIAALPVSEVMATGKRLNYLLLTVFFAGLLFLLFVVFILVNRSLKPVIQLANAMDKFSIGQSEIRLEINRADELGSISKSFNTMADAITSQAKQIQADKDELEIKVAERTASLKSILDNSGQGFFTFGPDFLVQPDYSRGCYDIFNKEINGAPVAKLLFEKDEKAEQEWQQGLELYFDGKTKAQVIFDLMDDKLIIKDKLVSIAYRETAPKLILCILTDITLETELAQRNALEAERQNRVLKAIGHKHFFANFIQEAENLFQTLDLLEGQEINSDDLALIMGRLHTFKANSGFFNFDTTQEMAHEYEQAISDSLVLESRFSSKDYSLRVKSSYFKELKVITDTMGEKWLDETKGIFFPQEAYKKLYKYVYKRLPADKQILSFLEFYRSIPLNELFSRLPFIAQSTAIKLGKKLKPMEIRGGHIRVSPERYQAFADACVHIVNNMVDHGIEYSFERELVQKSTEGKIDLDIIVDDSYIRFVFSDDGKGINLDVIERIAIEKGFIKKDDSVSSEDLLKILFADGFSTDSDVDKTSGRGVGMRIVKEVVDKLGGSIEIRTRFGKGTTFEIKLPRENTRKEE